MSRYDFAQVWYTENISGVKVSCTNPTAIENFISLLQPLNPKLKIERKQTQTKETWYWSLSEFASAKDSDILWWMIKQFGVDGWEPLGAYGLDAKSVRYQFKKTN